MRTTGIPRILTLVVLLACRGLAAAQGALTNGANHAGAISLAGEIDSWTFTANPGDYLAVRAGELPVAPGVPDPGFWPWVRILGPTGTVIAQSSGNTDAEARVTATLSGTYTALVGAYYVNGVGNYRLTLAKAPGAFQISGGDEGGAMTNGLRPAGRIDVGDLDMWSFTADQNDTIVVRVGEVPVSPGVPDPGFWPWIRVVGTNGAVLDQATGNLDAETTFRAPLTGTYTVLVGAYYGGGSGDYLVNLAKAPGSFETGPTDQGGAMTNGLRHTGSIGLGDIDMWSFFANQNDTFAVRAGEIAVGPGVPDPGFWPWVRVVGPTGVIVGQATGNTDAETSVRATLSGTYTVLVGAYYGGAAGDYRLALAVAPGAYQTAPGDHGGVMTNGTRYGGRIDVGDLDIWSFTATQGHTTVVRAGEVPVGPGTPDPGFWPWVRVISPAGVVVDQSTGNTDAEAAFTAPLSGTYTAIVGAYYGGGAGDYRFSVATSGSFQTSPGDHGGPLTNNVSQAGAIDLGDLDVWSFSACQGGTVVVTLSEVPVGPGVPDPGFWPWLRVIGPAGAVLGHHTNDLAASVTFTAPTTGTYTVVAATYYGGGTGDYVVRVLGACAPPPPPLPVIVNDSYVTAYETPLVVPPPGVMANDANVTVATVAVVTAVSTGTLGLDPNGGFSYTPPAGFSGTATFSYRATNATGPGNVATVTITVQSAPTAPTANNDSYGTPVNQELVVSAPGVLGNDTSSGGAAMSAGLVAPPSHGGVTLGVTGGFTYTPNAGYVGVDSFSYRASNVNGFSTVATVSITVAESTTAQPPTGLYASLIAGKTVTLRWKAPASGPAPTDYILEGGIAPGAPIVSVPIGTTTPIFTFAAPTGSYYVRIRTVAGGQPSLASNEILIHVDIPTAPSAPTGLAGLANGSSLELSWRNTFAGGAPANIVLEVSGAVTGSVNLGSAESFTLNGVPPGTYTFTVRATNGSGASPPSNSVTLEFPQTCSGAPQVPENVLVYKLGNTLHMLWDPAGASTATSHFLLTATGSVNVTVPLVARGVSTPVPPGTYVLSVAAVNACGTSAPTAPITVTFP